MTAASDARRRWHAAWLRTNRVDRQEAFLDRFYRPLGLTLAHLLWLDADRTIELFGGPHRDDPGPALPALVDEVQISDLRFLPPMVSQVSRALGHRVAVMFGSMAEVGGVRLTTVLLEEHMMRWIEIDGVVLMLASQDIPSAMVIQRATEGRGYLVRRHGRGWTLPRTVPEKD